MVNQLLNNPKEQGPYDAEQGDSHEFALPNNGQNPDTEAAAKGGDSRGHDRAAGDPSDPRGELRKAEGGLYKSDDASDDEVGDSETPKKSKQKKRGRVRVTKKKAIIGVGSSALVSVAFAFMSISSGPLEFIHLAQLMDRFHFSAQQNSEDGRMSKIVRYILDPTKPQNTRMGIVGNAVANKLETKIHDATGLSPKYDTTTGTFEGWAADPKHENFKGMTPDEMKASLASKYSLDAASMKTITVDGKQTALFNPDTGSKNSVKEYLRQTGFARTLLGEAGLSKLSAYAGTRVLTKRANWKFHPIQKLDSKLQSALIKAGKKGYDKAKKAAQDKFAADVEGTPTPAGGDHKPKPSTGPDGKPTTDPVSAALDGQVGDIQTKPTETNIKAKIAAGGAGLVGVICVLRNVDGAIAQEHQTKVVLPMMRLAGEFVSLGSQTQSGQDITATQLGFYKGYLDGTANVGGAVTSTWNQARSIQAELGQPQTGPDISSQAQVFSKDTPFSFLTQGAVGAVTSTACGVLGSTLGTIFSIVTGPVSYIVSGELIKQASSFLADWLSGTPINIAKSAGAGDGNYINYGVRASAGDQYASAGGVQLNAADEAALKNGTVKLVNADFQSKSLAYRIFNPYDSQTVAAKIIDNYGSSNGAVQGFASMIRNFGSIFGSTIRNVASLFSGFARAAPTPYDYHNMKKVGFSAADLANPLFDNSFDNACYVTGGDKCNVKSGPLKGTLITPAKSLLGDPTNTALPNPYIAKVTACFGDTISYDGSAWQIDYGAKSVDMYSSDYPSDCGVHSDPWLRIRFWILDTQTIEGYDCSQGGTDTSDKSCTDLGFPESSTSTATAPSTTPTTPTTSAGSTIDMAHLYDSSTNVACAPNTKDIGIQKGYTQGKAVDIRLCAISNLPSTGGEATGGYGVSGAGGNCPLNSRVSGAVYQMVQAAQKDGVTLTTDSCFRTMSHQQELWVQFGMDPNRVARPGTSNHQMGLAIDFSSSPGTSISHGDKYWNWLVGNANKFGYKNYPAEAWHWSPTGT